MQIQKYEIDHKSCLTIVSLFGFNPLDKDEETHQVTHRSSHVFAFQNGHIARADLCGDGQHDIFASIVFKTVKEFNEFVEKVKEICPLIEK